MIGSSPPTAADKECDRVQSLPAACKHCDRVQSPPEACQHCDRVQSPPAACKHCDRVHSPSAAGNTVRESSPHVQHVNTVLGSSRHEQYVNTVKGSSTNEEVRANIQQAIGPHEDFLTIVKRLKLQWVWSCLLFIRSGQNHLARHSGRGKKTRQTEEELERQHQGRQRQGMDRPGVRQVPVGSGEQEKWRKLIAKSSVVPQ